MRTGVLQGVRIGILWIQANEFTDMHILLYNERTNLRVRRYGRNSLTFYPMYHVCVRARHRPDGGLEATRSLDNSSFGVIHVEVAHLLLPG